jgi:2-dehydropantoate 2-reductase
LERKMRIAVFGAGGVGGYFGGRLVQAGAEVVFIARGAHLQAIQAHGLRVESISGDFTIADAKAQSDPAAVGEVDVVIVGVKAWQVAEAAQAIRPLIGSHTLVVPLQNGVDAPGQLAAVLDAPDSPRPHVIGGMCRILAHVSAPGVIQHSGILPYIAFNRLDHQPDERVQALHQALDRCQGTAAHVPSDIVAAMWAKFVFIAALSGVGAVARVPSDVLRAVSETRQMLVQAVQEIDAVGRARGVALAADTVERTLAVIDGLPPGSTTSMQRDIIAGRPSELESQTGAVVRFGRARSVPTPVNTFLYASLLPLENLARSVNG